MLNIKKQNDNFQNKKLLEYLIHNRLYQYNDIESPSINHHKSFNQNGYYNDFLRRLYMFIEDNKIPVFIDIYESYIDVSWPNERTYKNFEYQHKGTIEFLNFNLANDFRRHIIHSSISRVSKGDFRTLDRIDWEDLQAC